MSHPTTSPSGMYAETIALPRNSGLWFNAPGSGSIEILSVRLVVDLTPPPEPRTLGKCTVFNASCIQGGEIRTRDLLNPMPVLGVHQRPWALSLLLTLWHSQH